jgi:hypothetical protein
VGVEPRGRAIGVAQRAQRLGHHRHVRGQTLHAARLLTVDAAEHLVERAVVDVAVVRADRIAPRRRLRATRLASGRLSPDPAAAHRDTDGRGTADREHLPA